MATVRQGDTVRTRGEQVLRNSWQFLGNRSARGFSSVFAILVAHPTLSQGVYYLLCGLWALFGISSYQAVSGSKTDLWLLRSVGMLVAVIGAALCLAAYRKRQPTELIVIAFGSAVGFLFIDIASVARRAVSPVYLLDAVVEFGIVCLWIGAWRKQFPGHHPPSAPAVGPGVPTAAGS